jgi:hypothetical protein
MHTARLLSDDMFVVRIDGRPCSREEVLPDWGPLDRMGVVVDAPFGTIGASYLLQLAITAFYDFRPERRAKERPIYPDIFVFHVGGRYGDHANFDVYPPRKEVFVENGPIEVLNAINDRGITRLAVPDRRAEKVQHHYKEPAQALDRIVSAWAYSPDGRASGADVEIAADSARAEVNRKLTLHATESYHERQKAREALSDVVVGDDELMVAPEGREDEVPSEVRDRIRDQRHALTESDGVITERYRRISVRDALGMLHSGPAPAYMPQPKLEL